MCIDVTTKMICYSDYALIRFASASFMLDSDIRNSIILRVPRRQDLALRTDLCHVAGPPIKTHPSSLSVGEPTFSLLSSIPDFKALQNKNAYSMPVSGMKLSHSPDCALFLLPINNVVVLIFMML